jgi:formate dehydrogenase
MWRLRGTSPRCWYVGTAQGYPRAKL